MALVCPDQIAAQVKNKVVFLAGDIPFDHLPSENLPTTTLGVTASKRGMVKVFFGVCSYVSVDVHALQQSPNGHEILFNDPNVLERERIATSLIASVIEGFKPDIFPGLKISQIIKDIKLVDQHIIFTTLRLKSPKEGEERYKILVLKRAGWNRKYVQDNIMTLSVIRKKETIEFELCSQGASSNDTIEIRAIMNAVLGKLSEQGYIIYDPNECPGTSGKWVYDNFGPTD